MTYFDWIVLTVGPMLLGLMWIDAEYQYRKEIRRDDENH